MCSREWHEDNDRGARYADSCAALAARWPRYAAEIWAWGTRTEEMIGGPIEDTVAVLGELLDAGVPCYALTNMEAETYPRRYERFAFLRWFAGTVVSSAEGVIKPEPEIFRRLLSRYALVAERTVFIDDSPVNIDAASALGMVALRFESAASLRAQLVARGLLGSKPGERQETEMAKVLYTAEATVTGGRADGHGVTSDGKLDVHLRPPSELGGDGEGTNPEQLFAVGYAACFEGALGAVSRREKLETGDASIDSKVTLSPDGSGGFLLGVALDVTLPSIEDAERAVEIVAAAHQVCPYSNATRGNIEVALTANGRPVG